MKHYWSLRHESRRKLIMSIAFCTGMVCTSIATAAQNDRLARTRENLRKSYANLQMQPAEHYVRMRRSKTMMSNSNWQYKPWKSVPFEPLNRNLFVPAIYPETPPLVPASGPPTEEQVMTLLKKYLTKDWPNDPRIQRIGLEIFNHPLVKEKISNPSLRAALVGPGRTVAVDAIEFILFAQTAESLPK
jgi:hypothetical protein